MRKRGAERQRIKLGGYVKALAFSTNGASVSVVAEGRKVSSWDVGSGELRHESASCRPRMLVCDPLPRGVPPRSPMTGSLAAMSLWSSPARHAVDLSLGTQVGQVDLPREAEALYRQRARDFSRQAACWLRPQSAAKTMAPKSSRSGCGTCTPAGRFKRGFPRAAARQSRQDDNLYSRRQAIDLWHVRRHVSRLGCFQAVNVHSRRAA